ncbi:MAG TPA: MaoC family dehydratase, partial [Microthrixaceae bacterium]|nr:MaoC family dehydratase [Microthrixaceae bacterium]
MSDTTGTITDEGVERLRARIGIPEPHPMPPHYREPGIDAFRAVAEAYGDDNRLWCDPDYAKGTRWGGPIASPVLVGGDTLIGEDEVTAVADEHRDLMKGDPLRGVHAFYSASEREWWAPLRPGHRVTRRNALVGVLDKSSDFADRAIHEWTAQVFRADDGTILSGQYRLMIRTERSKARKRAKNADVELTTYTDDQIAEIDAQYASEGPRGAEPRWWEDVAVGD